MSKKELTTTRLVPVKPATTRSAKAITFSQNLPVLPYIVIIMITV